MCDHSCQYHCVDGECTINGCTRGCRNGYYKDSDNVCKTCSPNCNDVAKCNLDNGACAAGCKPGWTGVKCLKNCPEHCTYCNQVESDTCLTCQRGYYGKSCESKCSGNCKNNSAVNDICFKDNGICSHGCVQGHWGSQCDNVCSDGCADKLQCSTDDGRCEKCKIERYGDHCKLECSINCNNPNNGSNICDRGTGVCLYGCTSDIDGTTCTEVGDDGDESDNTVKIAAGAGSVVVVAVVVVVVSIFILRKRRRQHVIREGSISGGNDVPTYINVGHHDNLGQQQEMGQLIGAGNPRPDTSDSPYMDLDPASVREEHQYGSAHPGTDTSRNICMGLDPVPDRDNYTYESVDPDNSNSAYMNMSAETASDEKYINLRLT